MDIEKLLLAILLSLIVLLGIIFIIGCIIFLLFIGQYFGWIGLILILILFICLVSYFYKNAE